MKFKNFGVRTHRCPNPADDEHYNDDDVNDEDDDNDDDGDDVNGEPDSSCLPTRVVPLSMLQRTVRHCTAIKLNWALLESTFNQVLSLLHIILSH